MKASTLLLIASGAAITYLLLRKKPVLESAVVDNSAGAGSPALAPIIPMQPTPVQKSSIEGLSDEALLDYIKSQCGINSLVEDKYLTAVTMQAKRRGLNVDICLTNLPKVTNGTVPEIVLVPVRPTVTVPVKLGNETI